MAATGVDTKLREQQQVIEAQRSKVGSELKGLAQQQQQYILKAPFTGSLYLTNPDLAVGDWVGKSEKLGELEIRLKGRANIKQVNLRLEPVRTAR